MNPHKIIKYGLGSITILGGILCYGFFKLDSPAAHNTRKRDTLEIAIADMCKDDYIASVIAKSKYPIELASIAKVESDCRPLPRNKSGGDALGMYQVRERFHGEFGESIPDQTKKAEDVFEKLLYNYGYEKAFEKYNGKGKEARLYKKKVLKIRKELLDKIAKLDNNSIKR